MYAKNEDAFFRTPTPGTPRAASAADEPPQLQLQPQPMSLVGMARTTGAGVSGGRAKCLGRSNFFGVASLRGFRRNATTTTASVGLPKFESGGLDHFASGMAPLFRRARQAHFGTLSTSPSVVLGSRSPARCYGTARSAQLQCRSGEREARQPWGGSGGGKRENLRRSRRAEKASASSTGTSSVSDANDGRLSLGGAGRRRPSRERPQDRTAFDAHMKGTSGYDREHLHSARNLTGLQLTFLGTSGGAPTLNRNVTSLALEISVHRSVNETWLFDCGEATQTRLMQSNLKITNLTKIFITHMHGDHIFGLPGLLCMISNARNKILKEHNDGAAAPGGNGRHPTFPRGGGPQWAGDPVHIYGPPGIAQYVTMSLALSETGLSVPLVIHEFSDRSPGSGEGGAGGSGSDGPAKTHTSPAGVTNQRLRNKIAVGVAPADNKSLQIRHKIIQSITRDPENAKNYSWRKQNFGKNGVRRQQIALDKWECMRWHLDLGEANEAVEVVACPLKHRIDCWGYVIKEKDQPGKMDMDKVKALGLKKGPILKDLKNGQSVQCPTTNKWIKPENVLGPSKPGRKVVILGDTSDNRWIAQDARDADLVVHEATFNNEMRSRAFASGHSTAGMAGSFAKYVGAGSLILTHFSARFEDMGGGNSHWDEVKTKGKLKDLMAAERDQEHGSIALLKRQSVEKFGKKTVFAAEDLMVYCVEKKDPHDREAPSLVFPRRLNTV